MREVDQIQNKKPTKVGRVTMPECIAVPPAPPTHVARTLRANVTEIFHCIDLVRVVLHYCSYTR
jgi:hypothetical protein